MMVIVIDHVGDVGCENKVNAGGAKDAQASLEAGADKQWEARFPTIRSNTDARTVLMTNVCR
jgi:hypothetical protein